MYSADDLETILDRIETHYLNRSPKPAGIGPFGGVYAMQVALRHFDARTLQVALADRHQRIEDRTRRNSDPSQRIGLRNFAFYLEAELTALDARHPRPVRVVTASEAVVSAETQPKGQPRERIELEAEWRSDHKQAADKLSAKPDLLSEAQRNAFTAFYAALLHPEFEGMRTARAAYDFIAERWKEAEDFDHFQEKDHLDQMKPITGLSSDDVFAKHLKEAFRKLDLPALKKTRNQANDLERVARSNVRKRPA